MLIFQCQLPTELFVRQKNDQVIIFDNRKLIDSKFLANAKKKPNSQFFFFTHWEIAEESFLLFSVI